MVTITGDRPPLNDAFKSQLVDWYLHRVYDELDGPLTDAISKIPAVIDHGSRTKKKPRRSQKGAESASALSISV